MITAFMSLWTLNNYCIKIHSSKLKIFNENNLRFLSYLKLTSYCCKLMHRSTEEEAY